MSLRAKILVYLIVMHVLLGVVAVAALWERRPWLLAAEAVFVGSLFVGWALIREFFVPLELIRTGAELIRERDFTVHFREVGQSEMDQLIGIYNRMVDQLRDERQRLAEQHLLLDKVLAASPSGVVTLDFDGRVVLANPAAERLLEIDPRTSLGKRLEEVGTPIATELASVGVGGTRVMALSGGRRVRARRTAFRDRGFWRSFVLVEEMTAELRASEQGAYGKVIRMMSHEVKNSVGAVRSLLDSCRDLATRANSEDREDADRALQVAAERLGNLDSFVNGFADVVRLPDPDPRPCDLTRLISDVLTLFAPEFQKRKIRVAFDRTEALVATVDKNQLEQVLVNVLQNAMESIDEQGHVTIVLEDRAGGARLTITDDGAGIPDDVRSRLFTPFFSTKRDGRGIGLTVIGEILTRHGFGFALEPGRGAGAEFRVDFGRAPTTE